jgi:hypothetical protein
MVQFFQSGPSRTSQIAQILGQSLGEGLGSFTGNYFASKSLDQVLNNPELQNAPLSQRQSALEAALRPYGDRGQRLLQQRLQIENQGMLEKSLDELSKLDLSKMNESQIVSKYTQALAGLPNAELLLSRLLPTVLQQKRIERTPSLGEITSGEVARQSLQLPGYLEGTRYQPTNQESQPFVEQPAAVLPKEGIKDGTIQLGDFIPYNLGEQISPKQRAAILDDVRQANGDIDFVRQQIDDYNSGLINRTDLANSNIDKQSAQVQRNLRLEDQVKSKIKDQVPEDTPESKINLYYGLANKELSKHKDFTSAWQAISKKIADFDKLERKYIGSIPESGMYGLTNSQEKTLRNSAKPLLNQDPLAYNVLEEAFVQKGNSIIDASKTLKPLNPQVSNIISKAGDYKSLVYPKYNISDRAMLNNITMAQRDQDKEINNIYKDLEKIWNDDISLLNIYADLSKKGWFPEQIRNLFDRFSDKFSSQQEVERTQLNEHPRIPARYLLE